jgi:hypothetical protein
MKQLWRFYKTLEFENGERRDFETHRGHYKDPKRTKHWKSLETRSVTQANMDHGSKQVEYGVELVEY